MAGTENNPTVSIIIPTYNRSRLLARAVKSVLNQTYQNFELIIVDDASTDNTEEVVGSFNDERIKYVRHEKNKGEAVARNTGIKAARGEYIASHDSDDEWLHEKLAKRIRAFENCSPEIGVVYTALSAFG
jgi:glycosyltransferase involved in cell wall biosynthesis